MAISTGGRAIPLRSRMITVLAFVGALAAALSALAIVVLGPSGHAASAAAAAAAAAALAAIGFTTRAEARRRLYETKLAADLAVLSGRLIRMESREDVPDRHRDADLTSSIAGDVQILGRLVQELAESLERQGRQLADRSPTREADPPPPPAPDDLPRPAELPAGAGREELTTRDDFARAASAILRKLGPPSPARHDSPAPEAAVLAALEAGRIELQLQPVVVLPQRRTRYYETFWRLRMEDGRVLDPATFRPVLARARRRPALDAVTMHRTILIAHHLAGRDGETAVSCAICRDSLADPDLLAEAERRLEADRAAARRVVLEIPHSDLALLGVREQAALARFAALGTVLAVDEVPDLEVDWVRLVRQGFDYAKVDVATILEHRPPGETSELVRAAADAGMQVIATHVSREEFIPDLLDYDVPLAQGTAIATPRPVRAEIATPPSSDPKDGPPPAVPRSDEPRPSFRDYLRRAG